MNKLFEKLTAYEFKMINIAIPSLSDTYICIYLYFTFIDKVYFEKTINLVFEILSQTNPSIGKENIPNEFIHELWIKYTTTFYVMIFLYLFIHTIIFFFSLKDNKLAIKYINLYSKSASFLMILFAVFSGFNLINLGFILVGILHIINFSGIKYFKRLEE